MFDDGIDSFLCNFGECFQVNNVIDFCFPQQLFEKFVRDIVASTKFEFVDAFEKRDGSKKTFVDILILSKNRSTLRIIVNAAERFDH